MRVVSTCLQHVKISSVIVKTDDKNRGKWPTAIVQDAFPGKDGVTRAVKLKTAKSSLERPV